MKLITPREPNCKCGKPKDRLRKRVYLINGVPPTAERANSLYYLSECIECDARRHKTKYEQINQ